MRRIGFTMPTVGVRRESGERGAGIVEFAMVVLLLFVLAGGAFDYGQAWRTGLTVNEAARTGARVGSSSGPEIETDFYALSGLKASLDSNGQLDDVIRVVVFRADSADGKVPVQCSKGLAGGNCHTIEGSAFSVTNWETEVTLAIDSDGCLNVASHKDWCPEGRDNNQETAEFYGVWVKLRHDFLFPIMGSGTDVERTAVMRLEPKVE